VHLEYCGVGALFITNKLFITLVILR